jgi:hypothetical protein
LGEGLDIGGCAFFDGVFSRQRTQTLCAVDKELVLCVCSRVFKVWCVLREGCNSDGGRLVALSARETLPELLCQEGHEGVDHVEASLDGSVECLFRAFLLLFATFVEDGFAVLNVRVAQVLVEVLVGGLGGKTELACLQVIVDLLGSGIELMQNVPLR